MKQTAELKYPRSLSRSLEPMSSIFPIRLQLRSDLHLARKFWHMGMGLVIAGIYQMGLPAGISVLILSAFLAFTLVIEAIRLRNPSVNQTIIRLWKPVMRSCEVDRCTGIPFYLAASIVSIAVFPKPVAVLSILYLACGDPIASLVGILYGNKSIRFSNGKSLLGTLAGIFTCVLITFAFLLNQSFPYSALLPLSVMGGIAGGAAELVPLDMDDNFTIPVISGFVMWFAFIWMGLS